MALRGAVGFLTRLPVGRSASAWNAFSDSPATMVLVAYLIGMVSALIVVAAPGPTAAFAYPLALVALTGIAHLDGLADLGDAAVVHGPPAKRREVLADTVTGVGGTAAVALDVLGLGVAAFVLTEAPIALTIGLLVAAEVGAKLSMVGLASFGRPAHEGMGSTLVGTGPGQFLAAAALSFPAALMTWPSLLPLASILGALGAGLLLAGWMQSVFGGISGDVFGAANEVARLAGLYVGVLAWTLW